MFEDKYDKLSDEDIIKLIHEDDSNAMDFMLNRYKNLVRKKAKALYLIGGDRDDLIQEGMIGLYKAIRDYDGNKDNSFLNFADLCISRQIFNAIKASNRKKNIPLNTYVSLNAPLFSENTDIEEKPSLVDLMYEDKNSNPEEMVIDKENANMLEYELVRHLSDFEQNVLELYLEDKSYLQIADKLNKDSKAIDNAVQRIRTKLNKVLKKIKK